MNNIKYERESVRETTLVKGVIFSFKAMIKRRENVKLYLYRTCHNIRADVNEIVIFDPLSLSSLSIYQSG